MKPITRRNFMKHSMAAGVGLSGDLLMLKRFWNVQYVIDCSWV